VTVPDIAGKRVLVVGLGVSGFAVAKALADLEVKVRVTDGSDSQAVRERASMLQSRGIDVEYGGHDLDAVDADLAVVSPGIAPTTPIVRAIASAGVEIWSEVELAFRLAECDFLAVTGTNGKTTTTSLLAAILANAGVPTAAAGNIGYPLVEAIRAVPASGAIALEVSSFQLEATVTFRPRVGVLLNIAEDHIDWHGSFAAYRAAKARLVTNQGADDVFLPNADDAHALQVAEGARSRVVPFSSRSIPDGGIGVRGGDVVWRNGAVFTTDEVALPGSAGLEDAIAASGAALEYGVAPGAVAATVRSFRPLAHRLQLISSERGVDFIEDSKATNPHATLAALRGMHDVVLIAGGRSKGVDLSPLKEASPSLRGVVALGEAKEELERVFEGLVPVEPVDTMDQAVAAAFARSTPGGSVLLSPACASLDMYENYAARGEDFARAVRDLFRSDRGELDGNA
jgi:UDP-N-acetylmuramoylalanine--D-glutamate ligase